MHTLTTHSPSPSPSPPAKTLNMPIGYRFCPTDEEIIIHYLRPKVFSLPLPATAILHSDHLFLHHPSRLPGDPKEKRYFFYKPTSCNNNNNNSDASNLAGYWKPIIKNGNTHKLILATGCNHPIGFKKSFVFHQFNDHRRSASKTPWILHQFTLLYPLPIKLEEWVVCSIEMKSKNVKNNQHQGPAKRLKKSHNFKAGDNNMVEECISPDDDSSSGITFNEDLGGRKEDEDEDEEESRVN